MSAQRMLSAVAVVLATLTLDTAQAQVGRGCSVFAPCNKGYSCQPFIQKCYHSPRREGQPCSLGFECGAGLRCVPGVQQCMKKDAPPTGIIEQGGAAIGNAATQAAAAVQCPDMQMKCPTGQSFTRGTKWDPARAMCSPANAMSQVLATKCPQPYAGTEWATKWAGQATQDMACSAKLKDIDIQKEYSALFNDACIIHDLCYRSSMTRGDCDVLQLGNMQAVCYKLDVLMVAAGLSVAACLNVATASYAIVAAEGQSAYDKGQEDFGLRPRASTATSAPEARQQTPQRPPAGNGCAESVQGRIAWDYSGNTRWASENLDRLCRGLTHAEPGRCFERVMHGGVSWGGGTRWQWNNAIDLCEGSTNADGTVSCFQGQIGQGHPWLQAIAACDERAQRP